MPPTSEQEHQDKIRDRFTRTAEPFSQFVLSKRSAEADHLAEMGLSGFAGAATAMALDLACGPGTLTLAFAKRLRRVVGVDLTPAMLVQARQAATQARLGNLVFLCADANALPIADGAAGMATCGYAFHHLPQPARVIREMARVLRPGGRAVTVDLIVPSHAASDAHNRIERTRDGSHATTLRAADFRAQFQDAGLRLLVAEQSERRRDFDDWMKVAGWPPGSEIYAHTRRLMEASATNDTAGYRPALEPSSKLTFIQTSLYTVAEKI